MIAIFRSIKKLAIKTTVVAHFTGWKIENKDIDNFSNVLFPSGIISINSSDKVMTYQVLDDKFGFILTDGSFYIKKYGLKDPDSFVGRDENYLLFRDGNLQQKTKDYNLEAETVTIDANIVDITANNITLNVGTLNLNADIINIDSDNINVTVTNNITVNGIVFTFIGSRLRIDGIEAAVVGGAVQVGPFIGSITTSGQT